MTPLGAGLGRPAPVWASRHLEALQDALASIDDQLVRLERWSTELHRALEGGGRLLAVGNGGSAAQAQHLTAELVGRFRHERRPFSAIALHADTSAVTALANDYGFEEVFARQIRAHGRPGDVLVALSTSGRSANVVRAVETATDAGLTTWAFTGSAPNPLAAAADDAIAVVSSDTAAIQEVHQVLVHLLCVALDRCVGVEVDDPGPAADVDEPIVAMPGMVAR